jgi:hypothetical protein
MACVETENLKKRMEKCDGESLWREGLGAEYASQAVLRPIPTKFY